MRALIIILCGSLFFSIIAGCRTERTCPEDASVTVLFTGDVKGRLGPAG